VFLAVRAHGERFSEGAAHVPGRTGPQLREKWTNVLAPEVERGAWGSAEDAALALGVRLHGCGTWALIAVGVPGRTDDQCKRRWKQLRKDDAEEHQQVCDPPYSPYRPYSPTQPITHPRTHFISNPHTLFNPHRDGLLVSFHPPLLRFYFLLARERNSKCPSSQTEPAQRCTTAHAGRGQVASKCVRISADK
jgi:hypothetical protein